jgi:uncharacterized protein (TIGR02996 family)
MDLERSFMQDILDEPSDQGLWLILADWLEEQPEPQQQARGQLVRVLHALRSEPRGPQREAQEARLHELLRQSLPPCAAVRTNSIGMELALVPAGRFLMGSPEIERDRSTNEGPQHLVEITRPFFLGVCPVSQREYHAVAGSNPSHFPHSFRPDRDYPVEDVTWHEAVAFCQGLSAVPEERQAGLVYRLPTEAEWEYACRAGTTTPFFFGSQASSDEINFDGNYPYNGALKGPYRERPTALRTVGPVNPLGLWDLHGNVWEFCADWYHERWYERSPSKDPVGPSEGSYRIGRGGSWYTYGRCCRSAYRANFAVDKRYSYVGFRVLAEVRG